MFTVRRLAALALAMPALASAQPAAPVVQAVPPPATLPAVPPAPMPPAAPAASPEAQPKSGDGKTDAGGDGSPEEKKPEEKYFLESVLGSTPAGQQLLDNGWRIYGWTQGTYTGGTVRRSNLPVPFTDRAREFSLNQNYLHVEKTIDTSKAERQLGGTVDLILPGTDSRFSISRGLLDDQLGRTTYPIDVFQAYADFYAPNVGPKGTTFRGGKFATFLEYETVQAVTTPFASRSYLFQYNPFTHSGGLAITPLNDDWTVQNGIVLGNDNFFGANSVRTTYIGQVKWAPKDGPTTVALGTTVTNPRYDADRSFAYYNAYNLQVTRKLSDSLNYVLDATFSHTDEVPGIGSANWYGVVQYLFWDVTEKTQAKLRVELFEDSQGFRTGTAGLYTAVTGGLTWKVRPWLWIMPEVRYDHNSRNRPFEGDRDLFTATIGAILRW